jgi:hypothetical protein
LSRANIADHINEINKMLADGGSFVLYSEKQLEDLRSMWTDELTKFLINWISLCPKRSAQAHQAKI